MAQTWKDSELIAWKCETKEDLKTKYPDWTENQINGYLGKLIKILHDRGEISDQQLQNWG